MWLIFWLLGLIAQGVISFGFIMTVLPVEVG